MTMLVRMVAAATLLATTATFAIAADRASKEEAKALLEKALAHIDAVGKDQAYADFSRRDGGFVDRDLYVYCADMEGNILAHGANPVLIGQNLIDLTDTDGAHPIREGVRVVQTSGSGWIEFRFPNPVTKKIEAKTAFVSKAKDNWCGVGYYKN
jgi:signal transduction histidine kinase